MSNEEHYYELYRLTGKFYHDNYVSALKDFMLNQFTSLLLGKLYVSFDDFKEHSWAINLLPKDPHSQNMEWEIHWEGKRYVLRTDMDAKNGVYFEHNMSTDTYDLSYINLDFSFASDLNRLMGSIFKSDIERIVTDRSYAIAMLGEPLFMVISAISERSWLAGRIEACSKLGAFK